MFTKIRQAKSWSETPPPSDVSTFTIVCTDCYSTLIDKRQPSYARIHHVLASLDWYDYSRTATGFYSSSNAKTHDEDKLASCVI